MKNYYKENKILKAVLSTTVLPKDGIYKVSTLEEGKTVEIAGIPHYIGHPATKQIVEELGAVPAPSKLFEGLEVGEVALAFAIKQGRSNRARDGFSSPHQEVGFDDLQVRVMERLE